MLIHRRFKIRLLMVAVAIMALVLGCVVSVRRARRYDYHFWAEAGCVLSARHHEDWMSSALTEAAKPENVASRSELLQQARDIRHDAEGYRRRAAWHHQQLKRFGMIDRFVSRMIAPGVRE